MLAPADDTVVCRCEEITAGQIRAAARLGAAGPNQIKAFLRAGMGPCQGRMCGTVVAGLIAETRGASMEAVGALRPRDPSKPMTVGELANERPDTIPELTV
ncbi:(2Fe-2S)-binding protein [Methylobacterium oryzae CBMB20]